MKTIISEKIGFGGGCHWCTEAVFQAIDGVTRVDQGYIISNDPHSRYSEAVIVHFDPDVTELSTLIQIHLHTHSSSSVHSMRDKYRSAIYSFNKIQEKKTIEIVEILRKDFLKDIITEVLPFRKFKPSAETFCDYYNKDPDKPFCKTYIVPKLKFLEKEFSDHLKK